jgi:hypothetical protein
MHELHVNQRQRGDQSWSHLLTAIRAGPTENIADIAARLKSRVSNLAGGPVRERNDPLWLDAPRLVSTKTKQQAYNTSRLAGIVNGWGRKYSPACWPWSGTAKWGCGKGGLHPKVRSSIGS